jgi:SAM-dependent methyltransferase
MTGGYLLDQSWELEAERLRLLEIVHDPITTSLLTRLGVAPGWRCLEVGAGRGSMAAWLVDRVGDGGKVLAIDLDLTLIQDRRRPNLELARCNVLEDPMPQDEFDLVHARMVVSHLGARKLEAVRRMATALKRGGLLVIEEYDHLWNETKEWPASAPGAGRLLHQLWVGLAKLFEGTHDVNWGRWVAPTLRQAGLVEVKGEGRCFFGAGSTGTQLIGSGNEGRQLLRLTALRFRDRLVAMGALTAEEFDLLEDSLSRPPGEAVEASSMFVSAWGRRSPG